MSTSASFCDESICSSAPSPWVTEVSFLTECIVLELKTSTEQMANSAIEMSIMATRTSIRLNPLSDDRLLKFTKALLFNDFFIF